MATPLTVAMDASWAAGAKVSVKGRATVLATVHFLDVN